MMKLNVVILENMDDGFRGGYDWKQKDELDPCYKANERWWYSILISARLGISGYRTFLKIIFKIWAQEN